MPDQSSYVEEFIDLDDLDLADIRLEDLDDLAGGSVPSTVPSSTGCLTRACACWPRGGGSGC